MEREDFRDHPMAVLGLAHIALVCSDGNPSEVSFSGEFISPGLVGAIARSDVVARACERRRDRCADTPGSAGDYCNAPLGAFIVDSSRAVPTWVRPNVSGFGRCGHNGEFDVDKSAHDA